ncbi:hypothetical protein JCGZ_00998 [Jatropha curcas]|uniref:Transcription termination factor MTERF9, chloroplastic n=1 Tax=Jatropha curcas TaxID=180498 RepID=A0A067KSS8_JATCU|nr:transcription termination factor MTERF9, chloroplastic isoform X2 [Jatropha curcas]KDP39241.1 hypothetical protein JCGZ_00998 [Jatropha curcas]
MAVSSLYQFNPSLSSKFPSKPHLLLRALSGRSQVGEMIVDIRRRRSRMDRIVVLSSHSNAKVLKFNRKSRYGQTLSHSDEEEEEEEEDDDDDYFDKNDPLLDDEFAEPADYEVDGKRFNSRKKINDGESVQRQLVVRSGRSIQEKRIAGNVYLSKNKRMEADSSYMGSKEKLKPKVSSKNKYELVSEEIELNKRWFPLFDYLTTLGLKESDFIQMYERHMPCLQVSVCSAQERLEYLLSVGVKQSDIRRILLRQPQILEYTVENNLKSHVAFLRGLGIPHSKLGQIIAVSPSLFSYSVENSLKPTIRYLVEEVGIDEKNIGKVVQLSPQILVQRIDISWNTRCIFLSKELGASRESVLKMVTKHPQLLHYSIDDGILPRINFLRSTGMRNSDILKVLTSLPQVLSLSLEDNLKPKYMYLINELCNEVKSLTKYPTYLSLSLDQRIRPRHRFLVALKKAPKGPFPLSSFVPTDESFCQQWGTGLDKYLAFRQQLLLEKFAKKYDRQG